MGGCGRHVVDLVTGLDRERFDVTVMYGTSRIDDYYRAAIPRMAEHARLIPCDDLVRPISPARELRALRAVMRVMREVRPEVVHCHSSKAGVIVRMAVRLCGRRYGVRRVFYTPHAYSFQAPEFGGRKRFVFVGLERWMSRHATALTFNVSAGEREAALAERLDEPGKFEVVYNGVADAPVPSRAEARALLGLDKLGVPSGAPVVGVTARLVEQKDPLTAVAVMAKVVASRPDAHLVMVGDGDLEDTVREAVESAGIAGHVHLLGYRSDAEHVVSAFDVYLLTSLYEGMPYSLVEALRAGVPIAATDTTGNSEVVTPGVNGALFPVGDAEAGARAVLDLLADPLPSEQVRGTYLKRFTLDRMLDTIAARYEGEVPA
ncbi:glycosyltransferase [Bifidobacterium sp. CP2]|nr:glycosyltransferase [Bifidobacterium sp. CP2]MBT1180843.1 glycosyltransferase [Bifidobacterium sp. CP2]